VDLVLSRVDPQSDGGFLLIELLAATLLIAVVVGAFAGIFTMIEQRDNTLQQQSVLAATARPMLDTMAAELESAMCNGTTQPITAASGTQLTFTAPDRQQSYHLQRISYTLSNGVFTRTVALGTYNGSVWQWGTARTSTTVDSVTNAVVFDFRAAPQPGQTQTQATDLSPNGAAVSAANLSNIREVTMVLSVTPYASRGTGSLTAQGSASLRTPSCS
jgi:Tfp pilus assembly protein PilV